MPQRAMLHTDDPRQKIWDEIGNLDDLEITGMQVVCAIYRRPEKTASGLYLTDKNRDEDVFQGKVGMVVKMGPMAFVDETAQRFYELARDGESPATVGDWLFFRPSNGYQLSINGVPCRILDDEDIKGRIQNPDFVW